MKLSGIANKRIWKSRKLWAVILLGVFLIFFRPPVPDSIGQSFRCVFRVVTHLQSFKENLTTPYSGEQILPSAVQEMLSLLRKHKLSSYHISRKIKADPLLHQRIVESAWPRRMSPDSHYQFIFISDPDHSRNCREVERRKEVVLVFCR